MDQHDTIVRDVEQLARVLAQVLFHKRAGRSDQAQEVVAGALADALELGPGSVHRLSREEVLAACSPGGVLASEKALAVADLLREDGSAAGRERALWLYSAALESGGAVPFDIYERIASLRARPL